MKTKRRSKVLIGLTVLVISTLACATLSEFPEDNGDYSAAELRATQTAITAELAELGGNTPADQGDNPSSVPESNAGESLPRLSSQDLPEVDFGPPGEETARTGPLVQLDANSRPLRKRRDVPV